MTFRPNIAEAENSYIDKNLHNIRYPMEKVRFGVVGTNFITDWLIA